MKPFLVVGGGLSGLLAAKILKDHGIDFIGIERSDSLGGRVRVGPHRLYHTSSATALSRWVEGLDWDEVETAPSERTKGKWRAPGEENFSSAEKFYLGASYLLPKRPLPEVTEALAKKVGSYFRFHHTVARVFPDSQVIECADGARFEYKKLVWCAPLGALAKAWQGDKAALSKLFKKEEEPNGGILLELSVSSAPAEELAPFRNTVSLPFRFKDHTLRALGNLSPGQGEGSQLEWMVFLPPEIFENREEVAKCVRTLKREMGKEFSWLETSATGGRLVYLDSISGDTQTGAKSLAILPDVYYVGPQIAVTDSEEPLHNLDRVIDNCSRFEKLLEQ